MKLVSSRSVRLTLAAFYCVASAASSFAASTVIYGRDDRKDLFEVVNPMQTQLADSTVALVQASEMSQSSGMVTIKGRLLRDRGICASERFSDQPSGAFCSGSLVGKNTILTAGHCVTDAGDCTTTKFVFGYGMKQKGVIPSQVPSQEVYSCRRIMYRIQEANGADFALIELDRPVAQHNPLRLNQARRTVNIDNGTRLVMIGHPTGLPTKVEDGGHVRDNSKQGFFTATTDSYGGNSGSAVFNYNTGEIEGVLVRGETDYVSRGGCMASNMCSESGCRGEDVTKVASVLQQAGKIR